MAIESGNSRIHKTHSSRQEGAQKGQASILMGIMMLTFIFFFAFVVNVGMLVNAKINLQNAADLAAYAGAAVQARQLNQISYLNYEMRRQYKKFLFRYYVLGNMRQCGFPGTEPSPSNPSCKPQNGRGGAAKTPMQWSPDNKKEYGAPTVCLSFNPDDNTCQLSELPEIARAPGGGAFDSISSVLDKYITQIGTYQKQSCIALGMGNTLALQAWLWNLDPDWKMISEGKLANLPPGVKPEMKNQIQGIYTVIRGLGRGLGLVPQEIILRKRIDTLASYVNTEPQKQVTVEQVQEMKNRTVPEPPAYERTIQAFLSAYYTLGNHTFSGADIQMDEIMNPQLLKLKDNKAHFAAFAIDFPAEENQGSSGNCVPRLAPDSVNTPIPVGVYKDPTILTYYAIRLKAKVSLMFSPFGDVTLTAYAAAQPFGSRIGPKLDQMSDWTRPFNLSKEMEKTLPFGYDVGQIPNLPIRGDDDNTQVGNGWDTQEVMFAMHQAFGKPDGTFPKTIDIRDLDRAYHYAMAPNPDEGKHYNIPLDLDDSFVRNYDTNGLLAFWAPVFPLSKMQTMKDEIEKLIREYWPDGNKVQQSTRDAMIKQISTYLERLQKADGDQYDYEKPHTADGFRIVRLADPVHTREGTPKAIPGPFNPQDFRTELRTSWNDIKNSGLEGRIGYSVKLVAFPYLLSGKLKTSTGRETMINGIVSDPEYDADLPRIKH